MFTPAQIKPNSFESRLLFFLFFFFFLSGAHAPQSCLRACLDAVLLPQSYQYPDISEGAADSVGGQMSGDKIQWHNQLWQFGERVPESEA